MLDVTHINLLAVLVSAIIGIAIGFVWYHPKVFGTLWAGHVEASQEELMPSSWIYLLNFVAVLVMAYVLAQFIFFAEASNAISGGLIGFWTWLGFTATTSLIDYIFARRSPVAYMINYGYQLIILITMGAILGSWR